MNKQLTLFSTLLMGLCLTACVYKIEVPDSLEQANHVIKYENAKQFIAGAGSVTNVRELDIEWICGEISIENYDGTSLCFEETSDNSLPKARQLHYWKNGKKLYIRFCRSGEEIDDTICKNLIIKIPKSISLSEIDCHSILSDIKLNGIHCKEFDINNISGNIVLKQSSCKELDIETVSGNITTEYGKYKEYNIKSISGDIFINNKNDFFQMDIETISGNVHIHLPETTGFTMDTETSSGNITTNFPVSIQGGTYTYGNGKALISIENMSGDIELTK